MALFLNKVCLCYTEYKIKFCIVNWAAVSVGGVGGTVNFYITNTNKKLQSQTLILQYLNIVYYSYKAIMYL